ncbi:alpha/beta hydrolase [Mycobacterium sp. GA-2829]|uniref:alpha/beta hydrolase n=1 Tax=Mycobacterium sp. GA-2829 TaxID=1772283 RepID=UPI0007405786|nr:alpha/beta hydrolase [Mycobacterium sp. GA-2829]KUI35702.1 alpha/beta hydrolase [Mycobacterium sp. GA-2829]
MIPAELRRVPTGQTDVTAPVAIDGLTYIAADDPAMPMYRVIANNRQPVALRDLMIRTVRSGYIGDGHQPDPALVPPSGAEAVPGVDVDQVYLPVRDGVARCQLYRPAGAGPPAEALPVIVYYHGGGFTVGVSEDCDFLARKLAFTNGALVVSANYRSAPEFMFPTPLDDAFDVYRWVTGNAGVLGGDPDRIAVAGDSAGSNFAAVLPLRARDEGVRIPDAVVMLGAMPDFQFERWESFRTQAPRGIVYDMSFAGFIRGAYVGATAWDHPYVSPIEGELSGYPLAVITAGTHDPIVDSARAFADRIRAAGGRTVDYFPDGMPHGYYFFPGVHPEEDVAYRIVADALAEPFRRPAGRAFGAELAPG